jgi:TRAP-type C4-dicarboxylate transport system permease small subunit
MNQEPQPGTAPKGAADRFGDGLAHLCLMLAGASLACIVVINGANVVARYVLRSPFSWAEEMMLYLMILSVFAGAIAVTWRNLHIRIDTFIERTPPTVRRIAMTASTLMSVLVMGTVVFASARIVTLLYAYDQRSDALDAPVWIPQSFVPVGLGIMALIMLVKMVTTRFYKDPPAPIAGAAP